MPPDAVCIPVPAKSLLCDSALRDGFIQFTAVVLHQQQRHRVIFSMCHICAVGIPKAVATGSPHTSDGLQRRSVIRCGDAQCRMRQRPLRKSTTPGHEALAVFIPLRVSPPVQERHFRYDRDGNRIRRYFDFSTEEWIEP